MLASFCVLYPPSRGGSAPTNVKAEKPVRGCRIARVHEYWVTVLGGERIFQGLAPLFPDADTDIFMRDPQVETPPKLAQLRSTYLQRPLFGARHFRALLPLYPSAARRLDLRGYDLVINSGSDFCHAARTDGAHLCCCRSPLRSAWNVCEATLALQLAGIRRALVAAMFDRVRRAYLVAARRVTRFVAHSETVRQRIATSCGRPNTIVRPCIDMQRFRPAADQGDTFRGRVSEDDIGMAALEAQAAGGLVIAYRAGGALETVIHGRNGILFHEQSVERLEDAPCAFTPDEFASDPIRAHAEVFSEPEFRLRILDVVREIGSAPHQVSDLLRRDPSTKASASEPAQQDGQSGSAWRRWRRHQDDSGGGYADNTEWRRGADQEVAKW